MARFVRRLAAAAAGAVVASAAAVIAPISMAWSAPALRLVELDVPVARSVTVPFARLVLPLAQALPAPFELSHVGVRWTGSESAVVQVRTAPAPGRWGAWQPVEVAPDLGDEARSTVLSGLLRADGARLVQARARGQARDLTVVAIDAVHGPRHLVRAPALPAAGAEAAQPPVVTRAQWGANESMRRPTPPTFAPITRMVVHHTATPNDDPDPASTMRAMLAYHVQINGWDDLGYNFVIDGAGRIYEGRWARTYDAGEAPTGESLDGQGVVGAHAEGDNDGSVGVAVMGTFTGRSPPQPAVDALQRLLAWKAERHGIDPAGTTTWDGGRTLPTIVGHRDVGDTSCPGDRLQSRLPAIRSAVAGMVQLGGSGVTPGYVVLAGDGRAVSFGGASAGLPGLLPGLVSPAAGVASTPSGRGYWAVSEGGRILPSGDAGLYGSPELTSLLGGGGKAVAIEATPSGLGYWVAEEGGRVWSFGDAPALGSAPWAGVVGLASTPSGRGYWTVSAGGRVSTHGDAPFLGATAGRDTRPIVAVMGAAGGRGYWLVAADGTVFPFGTAPRLGGLPERRIATSVVDARPTSSGRGYYLLGTDGAVYPFGDARFFGTAAGQLGGGAAGLAVP